VNPGLRYLLASRLPGALRRIRRKYSGREGKILLLGVALLFAAILVSQSEVQFLFPAPISRVQLLAFNIISRLQIVLLSTLWVSVFTVRHAATWYGGVLAVFMLLSFNQLTAQLGGVWLAGFDPSRAARRRRWIALGITAILVVAGIFATLPVAPTGLADATALLIRHPLIEVLAWVTRPFVELFLSARPADLLLHGGIAAAILGAEIFAMVHIDQSYLDGLAAHGRVVGTRSKKVRLSIHRDPSEATRSATGIRIPSGIFPRLAGAGPLAWRQAQELLRNPATLLRGGLGLFAVLPVFVIRASAAEHEAARLGAVSLATALLMIPMMVEGADFRRDLDRMSVLRALPMSASAVVMGQLIATAILIGFWMMVGSLMILIIIDMFTLPIVCLLVLTIPPFALMTAAIDNWLFLLMPYRVRTRDPGESTFVGRLTVVMSIKMVVMLLAICICVGVTLAVWSWVIESAILAGIVASLTLAGCCVPLILGLARTFQKFDVSQQGAE